MNVRHQSRLDRPVMDKKAPIVLKRRVALASERRTDRRVRRTQESLRVALRALICEKRFDDITVEDVIERANVGRSTFYAHYRCKEDLFRSDFERFLGFWDLHESETPEPYARILPARELFEHVREFHAFARALAASGKLEALERMMTAHLAGRLEKRFAAELPPPRRRTMPPSILAHHVASSLLGLLDWWLRNAMPHSPERMDEIFHALVMPAVHS